MSYFNKNQLPFNIEMESFWKEFGFIVIENFYSDIECENLRKRAEFLINDFNPNNIKSIFDTNKQKHAEDKYFLESGDKIRFFYEEKAFNDKSQIIDKTNLVINKIGHALHDLDEEFYIFSHRKDLDLIAKSIGVHDPKLLQSMYIFKQPLIGGEVICHQDSTFLFTDPETAVGFWVAIEDANNNNGCLQVTRGGHKGPLRKLFTKKNGKMIMINLDNTPFEKTETSLEVKKGTLVLLHGRLPHYSCENTSTKSRHAYTFHIIDGNSYYPKTNWLQRPHNSLNGFV